MRTRPAGNGNHPTWLSTMAQVAGHRHLGRASALLDTLVLDVIDEGGLSRLAWTIDEHYWGV